MKTKPGRSRTILFFAFAAWAVGSTAGSLVCSGAGTSAHARFDREKRVAAAGPAASPTTVFPEYRATKTMLDHADELHDRDAEAVVIARAIERAGVIERGGSALASLAAAKLIEEAGDRLDRDPALLAKPAVLHALAITDLSSSAAPFARERASALAALTTVPGNGYVPDTRVTRTATGVVMRSVDDTLGRMQESALRGNVASCRRAAEQATPLVRAVVSGPVSCENADRVVHAGRRLASLRVRASVARTQSNEG